MVIVYVGFPLFAVPNCHGSVQGTQKSFNIIIFFSACRSSRRHLHGIPLAQQCPLLMEEVHGELYSPCPAEACLNYSVLFKIQDLLLIPSGIEVGFSRRGNHNPRLSGAAGKNYSPRNDSQIDSGFLHTATF